MRGSNYKHGLSYSPEYRAWQTMRLRCANPKNAAWPAYGGRGITVCKRWLDDPTAFYKDMGPKPSPEHELDRIDNDAGYFPENCRWVLRKINDRNRRSNRHLTRNGETLTIAEWCERTGLAHNVIRHRLQQGWPVSIALSTPARPKAANGMANQDRRHPCSDCGKPILLKATRCITCSNRSRAR